MTAAIAATMVQVRYATQPWGQGRRQQQPRCFVGLLPQPKHASAENVMCVADLLARCALKDERAFAALYRVASPRLFEIAKRITGRPDWAEEVLQESFVSIWYHAGRYDPATSAPMTWMTAIVRNRALDWWRRPREAEAEESQDEFLASIPDVGPGPEELACQSEYALVLAHCMRELPELQHRAITLAFQHGLSHAEVSAKLGCPLGTAKTWIRRGLQQLRNCLHEKRCGGRVLAEGIHGPAMPSV
ncbi:MAG: sigma-70 family RNA polymerase sigma factor [Burkholderiales bacterium]